MEQRNEIPEGWTEQDGFLQKTFQFETYEEVNTFLPHLAGVIVKQNHHADFTFDGSKKSVFIKTKSHDTNSITERDIRLAEQLNLWGN